MSSTYTALLAEHAQLPSFVPLVSQSLLPSLAMTNLAGAFVLAFYFSTLPSRGSLQKEIVVAICASLLGGFGIVFGFCSVGANV